MIRGRRSRSRSKTTDSSWALLVPVGIAAVLIISGLLVAPSVAFTTGSVDRGTTAPLATDDNGFLGIDVTESLQAGSSGNLVTVTNNLNRTLAVDVAASATLSNSQAILAPNESVTTTARVSCESPPSELELTVAASTNGQFSGLVTRSAPVDPSDCANSTLAFGTVEITDQTTSGKGGKAEYAVGYSVEGDTSSFDRVAVDFENLNRDDGVATRSATTESGTISFESGGKQEDDRFEITVRLFNDTGEVQSEQIVVTDAANGSGTVYTTG